MPIDRSAHPTDPISSDIYRPSCRRCRTQAWFHPSTIPAWAVLKKRKMSMRTVRVFQAFAAAALVALSFASAPARAQVIDVLAQVASVNAGATAIYNPGVSATALESGFINWDEDPT